MNIVVCPFCRMRVLASNSGVCPSCGENVFAAPSPQAVLRETKLTPDEDRLHRNMRAIALLHLVYGGFLLMGSVLGMVLRLCGRTQEPLPSIEATIMAVSVPVGVVGILGGLGILLKRRRWAKVAYGMAIIFIFPAPFGTLTGGLVFRLHVPITMILAGFLIANLPRYLQVLDKLHSKT